MWNYVFSVLIKTKIELFGMFCLAKTQTNALYIEHHSHTKAWWGKHHVLELLVISLCKLKLFLIF